MPATRMRHQKTAEVVADSLRARIARGQLGIGDHLPPEEELMAAFGVARTTMREALRILESQGLIEVKRGRRGGGRVISPRLDRLAKDFAVHLQVQGATVDDLDRARRFLEPPLCAHLAREHTPEDLAALEEAIAEASQAADAGDNHGFGLAAVRFHETIIERADNLTLVMITRVLHEVLLTFYVQASRSASRPLMQRAVRGYRKLLGLIAAGDAEGAEAHWRAQMAYTATRRADELLDVYPDLGTLPELTPKLPA